MRFPPHVMFAVLALFVSSATALPTRADAADYEIKLTRAPKVGQKYTLKVEGALTRETTLSMAGREATSVKEGFGVQLEGTVEVLGINGDGEEAKVAFTVSKCIRLTEDGESEIVPAGRVVTATGGKEDTTFTIDQGELSAEAKESLDLVLRMGEEDGFNDDKIYGTTKRQPLGATWALNAQAASDEAKADGFKFEPKDITGSLKLEKVEKVGDIECLRIGGDTHIKSFVADPPPQMTFDRGELKARYWGLYPVDSSIGGTLAEAVSVTHTTSFHGKTGEQEARFQIKTQRAVELKRSFVKE
jgi:hypothetical protein